MSIICEIELNRDVRSRRKNGNLSKSSSITVFRLSPTGFNYKTRLITSRMWLFQFTCDAFNDGYRKGQFLSSKFVVGSAGFAESGAKY
jgi:hypothetical protein